MKRQNKSSSWDRKRKIWSSCKCVAPQAYQMEFDTTNQLQEPGNKHEALDQETVSKPQRHNGAKERYRPQVRGASGKRARWSSMAHGRQVQHPWLQGHKQPNDPSGNVFSNHRSGTSMSDPTSKIRFQLITRLLQGRATQKPHSKGHPARDWLWSEHQLAPAPLRAHTTRILW